MPKMKTHRGAAKRFKKTGTGKLRRYKAYKGHKTGKKSPKRVRNLRKGAVVNESDYKRIKNLLPY